MGKECWVGPAYPVEPVSRAFGLVAHPLELAAYPPDDIGIDPLQGRTQLRLVEVAVVGDPASDASAPRSAPSSVGQPPERRGQPPSECPTVASHHSPLEYRPVALAEESSSLTTVGSRACRGCPIGWPRTPQSTGHPRQPLPGWPSHA